MQSLDVISVNIWSILISFANLIILFLLIKKFLYKPVEKMLAARQEKIDSLYRDADKAKESARQDESYWHDKMSGAKAQAAEILQKATDKASRRSDKILGQAKEEADGIIRQAQKEADLELKKAEETIKREIVDVSAALAEKMLSREIDIEDHRKIIGECLDSIQEI